MNESKKISSQQELRRLLVWTKDNPEDWNHICHPESYHTDVEYLAEMVERLYQAGLYTIMMQVIYANCFSFKIEQAITKTINECFLDMPAEVLMERFWRNLRGGGV